MARRMIFGSVGVLLLALALAVIALTLGKTQQIEGLSPPQRVGRCVRSSALSSPLSVPHRSYRQQRTRLASPSIVLSARLRGGCSASVGQPESCGSSPLARTAPCSSCNRPSPPTSFSLNRTTIENGDPKNPMFLYAAALKGDAELIRSLVKRGADVNTPSEPKATTALIQAAANGHTLAVETLIDLGADVNLPNDDRISPLLSATMSRRHDIMQILLEAGADPNSQDLKDGHTPLYVAVLQRDSQACLLLMDHDADPNRQTKTGQNPVLVAAAFGDVNLLRLLIKDSVRMDVKDDDGMTVLMAAAHCQPKKLRVPTMSLLLRAGADVNQRGAVGRGIIGLCVELGDIDTMKFLVSRGADAAAADKYGLNALMLAIMHGNDAIFRYLMDLDVPLDAKTVKDGHTALMSACQVGDVDKVRLMLSKGANPNIKSKKGAFALLIAAEKGAERVVEALVNCDRTSINQANDRGITALMAAAANGDRSMLFTLLDEGADINQRTPKGETALYFAAKAGRERVIAALLARGAIFHPECLFAAADFGHVKATYLLSDRAEDIDARDSYGSTALFHSCGQGHYNCSRVLLARGADANVAETDSGLSCLHTAIISNHTDIVKLLIESNAKVDCLHMACDISPLGCAAQRGHVEIIRMLLDAGAEVNKKDLKGMTALCRAAAQKRVETCRYLLSRGADIDSSDPKGFTALAYAANAGDHMLVDLLLDHGAEVNRDNQRGWTPIFAATFRKDEEMAKHLARRGANLEHKDIYNHTVADYWEQLHNISIYHLAGQSEPYHRRFDPTKHPKNIDGEDTATRARMIALQKGDAEDMLREEFSKVDLESGRTAN